MKNEITAKCSECGKEQTGNRDFLRGLGWEFKRCGKTECLNCRIGDDLNNRRPRRGGGGRGRRSTFTFSR